MLYLSAFNRLGAALQDVGPKIPLERHPPLTALQQHPRQPQREDQGAMAICDLMRTGQPGRRGWIRILYRLSSKVPNLLG